MCELTTLVLQSSDEFMTRSVVIGMGVMMLFLMVFKIVGETVVFVLETLD